MKILHTIFVITLLFLFSSLQAQDTIIVSPQGKVVVASDSIPVAVPLKTDSAKSNKHIPRRATIRSAIIPGWGQIYNKKYWKVPLVYGAIGVPVGFFIYNKKWYDRTREAARMLGTNDTIGWKTRVDPQLHIFFDNPNSLGRLLNYRNEFRKNMDYSILFTLLMWGLNVVDATVDAHLKEFDVSDDLSLKIKPTILTGNSTAGISLVFTLK